MNDRLFQIAALKVFSAFAKDKYDEVRADAEDDLNPGDRRMVVSPLDGKTPLGEVYRSNPKDVAIVADEDALTTWVTEHYRADTESKFEIVGTQEQILQALLVHAPHLIKQRRRVKQAARIQLLNDATRHGVPVGPSGEADIPGIAFTKNSQPFVACKADKDAVLPLFELYGAGRLSLDGTLLPAIEAPVVDGELVGEEVAR